MGKCDYCGTVFEKGTGKLFIKDSGKMISFCSNKCEVEMLVLKRKARDYKWTEISRKERASKKTDAKSAEQPAPIKNEQ